MATDWTGDAPAPHAAHVLGQELDTLSVDELNHRIALLQDEIVRIERAVTAKTEQRALADKFFGKA
jgi:uncharacterized small protein (DUF1192 family)